MRNNKKPIVCTLEKVVHIIGTFDGRNKGDE